MTTVTCQQGEMKLVYCQKCRNPIGRLAIGSKAELKCRACGVKTYFEVVEVK